jgi:hypothetical protein
MKWPFRCNRQPRPDRNAAILDAISQLTKEVKRMSQSLDNLNTNEAALEAVVASVAAAMTTQTALMATIHQELIGALANSSNQDPAIQAAADRLQASISGLTNVANALNAATAANPDPNAPAAPVEADPAPAAPVDGSQPS